MSRHGKKFCMICNPYGDGFKGDEGTEAVGQYFLQRTTKDQFQSGWISICSDCVEVTKQYFEIEYFDGKKTTNKTDNTDSRIHSGSHLHNWGKDNLVTLEIDGKLVDHIVCEKCGANGYWPMIDFAPKLGCSIPDCEVKSEKTA